MRLNVDFAEELLARQGFALTYVDYSTGEMGFSQPEPDDPGFFSVVQIKFSGELFNIAVARVGISCIQGKFSWRGLTETVCVTTIADDKKRGRTTLHSVKQLELWLQRLYDALGTELGIVRSRLLPVLRARIGPTLMACKEYLRLLGFPISSEDAKNALSARVSEAELIETNLVLSHEVGWLGDSSFHFVAVLAILHFWPWVEPEVPLDFQNPTEDTALMWRIRIIADRVMAFPNVRTLMFPAKEGTEYWTRAPLLNPRWKP